ncbi:hypothetical protein ABW19_dt0206866 [Dactylella cylindrospora]|nr:hypothetical protein ABW19_dt0206866 [Dactylella cylindrospora]
MHLEGAGQLKYKYCEEDISELEYLGSHVAVLNVYKGRCNNLHKRSLYHFRWEGGGLYIFEFLLVQLNACGAHQNFLPLSSCLSSLPECGWLVHSPTDGEIEAAPRMPKECRRSDQTAFSPFLSYGGLVP